MIGLGAASGRPRATGEGREVSEPQAGGQATTCSRTRHAIHDTALERLWTGGSASGSEWPPDLVMATPVAAVDFRESPRVSLGDFLNAFYV